jgi:hypothetical protein
MSWARARQAFTSSRSPRERGIFPHTGTDHVLRAQNAGSPPPNDSLVPPLHWARMSPAVAARPRTTPCAKRGPRPLAWRPAIGPLTTALPLASRYKDTPLPTHAVAPCPPHPSIRTPTAPFRCARDPPRPAPARRLGLTDLSIPSLEK